MYYSHVWFDLGQTLVSTNRAEHYKNVLADFGVDKSVEEIEIAYHVSDKLFMREYKGILGKKEKIFLPWYLGILNYNLRVELDLNEVYQSVKKRARDLEYGWKAFSYSKSVINELKNMGISVGLISNWDNSCRDILVKNDLLQLLDTVVISSEVGFSKPSKEIFEYALHEAKAYANRSIYVGDNYYDDVIGASKVGMPCILINPYDDIGIQEINFPHIIKDIREVIKYLEEPYDKLIVS